MNQKTNSYDHAVQTFLDKQEICKVLVRYCRAIDQREGELLHSVFHPDAMVSYGIFDGKASDFCEWSLALVPGKMKFTSHTLSNVLIEVEGDVARSEAYSSAFHRIVKDGKAYDLVANGRYVDRFERRNGVWKIAHRHTTIDWIRCDPSTEELGAAILGEFKPK